MRCGSPWSLVLGIWVLCAPMSLGLATDPPPSLGQAHIGVDLQPLQDHVRGVGSVDLALIVHGAVWCVPGSPPASLVGTVLPGDDRDDLLVAFDPRRVVFDWERGTRGGVYRLNGTGEVTVMVLQAPEERVVADFQLLLEPNTEGGAGCTAQGYTVTQSERSREAITVEPEAVGPPKEASPGEFNGVAIVLALALMGVVALFAFQRERRRRE